MSQPIASESALSDECPGEFRPLIRVKVGVAVRRKQLGASPALPRGFTGVGIVPGCHPRSVKGRARRVKSNLLSSRFQQQDVAA